MMTIKMFTVKMICDVCRASAPYHERIGKMFPKKGKEFPPEMKGITAHELATEIGKTLPVDTVDAEAIGFYIFRREGVAAYVAQLEKAMRDPSGEQRNQWRVPWRPGNLRSAV